MRGNQGQVSGEHRTAGPLLTTWQLLSARLASSPAAHHVLRLVSRCRRPAMPKRVHHVPHLQPPR